MKAITAILSASLLLVQLADARTVKGKVSCQGQTLQGVIVTDGKNFTVTKSNGGFRLKLDPEAPFVSVVSPSGYTVDHSGGSPVFYKKVTEAKRYDFELLKAQEGNDYTLLAVSDPQMKTEKHFRKFSGLPLEDVKKNAALYSSRHATAGLLLGDIGWDSISLINPLVKSAMSGVCVPFYPVIGNHDFNRDKKQRDSRRDYEEFFGPVNYAFCLGSDIVIVLKNIIYDTNKKFVEGYTDEELDFVRNILKYIPENQHIIIAQHSPLYRWFHRSDIENGEQMLSILSGRKVDFICGHTHISNHLLYSDQIAEHNPGSICGTWWDTQWCNDGTPRGYSVFSSVAGQFSWFYHAIDFDDDFQVSIIKPGESRWHPNSVIANVWDADGQWSIEWYQDGIYMGSMEETTDVDPKFIRAINETFKDKEIPKYKRPRHNIHYYAAEPSQYAKTVTVKVKSRFGKEWSYDVDLSGCVDVQAHRGGAGLAPENTKTSMKNAMDLGCNTLELDLQISADSLVVVSHDNYFHPRLAIRPDGSPVLKGEEKEYLFSMPYDSIAKYEVGLRSNDVWPEKLLVHETKPLLKDLIEFCESYAVTHRLSLPRYNIEIKSREGKGEGKDWPEYHEFVDLCMQELLSLKLGDRLVVQCFDVRALNYMNKAYPGVILSYLTDSDQPDFDEFMSLLDFTPDWLSPEKSVVSREMVDRCHKDGMKIVPWTEDSIEGMRRLMDLGCDAIITNYPDRLLSLTRGY